jgi:hypothetical protein
MGFFLSTYLKGQWRKDYEKKNYTKTPLQLEQALKQIISMVR